MRCRWILFLACSGIASSASGAIIDAREINIVANEFIIQHDLTFLNASEGWDVIQVQQFETAATLTGWQTRLHGLHNGKTLDVTYTGSYSELTPTTSSLSYTSTGVYGSEVWSGGGGFAYTENAPTEDVSGGLSSSGLGCQVGISGRVGLVSINVGLDKDYLGKQLEASVGIGIIDIPYLGSLINTGGKISLNQATGEDQCYVFTDIAWGLIQREKAVGDKTQLFRIPTPPPPPPPPVRKTTPPPPYPYNQPPWESPTSPAGSTPGSDGLSPGDTLYDRGYVGAYETPEPIGGLALLTFAGVLRRDRR